MIVSDQVVPAIINATSVVSNDTKCATITPANLELRSMEAKTYRDWETDRKSVV